MKDWKNNFSNLSLKHKKITAPQKAVSSLVGARELLAEVAKSGSTKFKTKGGDEIEFSDATDEQVRQLMKALGVMILSESILDSNGNPIQ